MKLPRSVLERMRAPKGESFNESEPTTAEGYYDRAVSHEESGDRWFSSDLSKAIRFYYRSHVDYLKALKLDPINEDALYNLPRLEYEVYSKYTKEDSVILDDLTNCADVLNDNGKDGLFQDIQGICKHFESSISILQQSGNESLIGYDFYFNIAICYSEYIDILCSNAQNIMEIQLGDELTLSIDRCMQMFLKFFEHIKHIMNSKIGDDSDTIEDIESITNGCIESYRMIATVYESLYSDQLIMFMDGVMGTFVEEVDTIANTLVPIIQNIGLLNTLKISKLNERCSRVLNCDEFLNLWSSHTDLNSNLQKRLMEASSMRSFIDKFEVVSLELSINNKWSILGTMSNQYRSITDIIKREITDIETSKSMESDLLSSKIILMCSIFIERADIELERSLVPITEAISSRTILQNNSKTLLKNALIFSKKSGGIRESIMGKLSRKKRQREAAMRLCLLEGKHQNEWNTIIGEQYWPAELNTIGEIEAYKSYFS